MSEDKKEKVEENRNLKEFANENELLKSTLLEIDSTDLGKIDINGTFYTKVSKRIEIFRKNFGFNAKIETEVAHLDEVLVLMKATISIFKNDTWFQVATGHAEERRDSSEINKTSAVENAETSAIGRALACLGISGEEYASADELVRALAQKTGAATEVKDSSNKNINYATPPQIQYIEKLIKKTSADRAKFLEFYQVKDITELTAETANKAISKLKRKESLNEELKKDNEKAQQETNDALSVLEENNKVKFKSIDTDEGTESVVEHSLEKTKSNANEKAEEKEKEDTTEVKEEAPVEDKKEDSSTEEKTVEETSEEKEDPKDSEEEKKEDKKKASKSSTKKEKSTKKDEDKEKKAKGKKTTKPKSSAKKGKQPEEREKPGNDLDEDDEILM